MQIYQAYDYVITPKHALSERLLQTFTNEADAIAYCREFVRRQSILFDLIEPQEIRDEAGNLCISTYDPSDKERSNNAILKTVNAK